MDVPMRSAMSMFVGADGKVHMVYSDVIDLREIGHLKVERISEIQWNEALQCHEVEWREVSICRVVMQGSGRFVTYREAQAWEVQQVNGAFERMHRVVGV